MQNVDINYSEMLGTRICHDLAGVANAVNNGLEIFLEEKDENLKQQAAELLSSSATELMARLKFFRIAYGRVEKDISHDFEEIEEIFRDFFAQRKISIVFSSKPEKISSEIRRILFSAIIIVSNSLLLGGEIKISFTNKSKIVTGFEITGSGKKIKNDPIIQDILNGNNDIELMPNNINIFLLQSFINASSLKPELKFTEEVVVLKLT